MLRVHYSPYWTTLIIIIIIKMIIIVIIIMYLLHSKVKYRTFEKVVFK